LLLEEVDQEMMVVEAEEQVDLLHKLVTLYQQVQSL
jgi:hypothetical protein